MEKKAYARVYYLDWLRVLAILFVLVYHSTRFFNPEDWHVKNPITYQWVEWWNRFAGAWMMPLIFVISGASLFYAVGKGGTSIKAERISNSCPITSREFIKGATPPAATLP
jgi:peptidoglycan/LPS O-acetylase OafA/YrhL